jgi:hypothetical protein
MGRPIVDADVGLELDDSGNPPPVRPVADQAGTDEAERGLDGRPPEECGRLGQRRM